MVLLLRGYISSGLSSPSIYLTWPKKYVLTKKKNFRPVALWGRKICWKIVEHNLKLDDYYFCNNLDCLILCVVSFSNKINESETLHYYWVKATYTSFLTIKVVNCLVSIMNIFWGFGFRPCLGGLYKHQIFYTNSFWF